MTEADGWKRSIGSELDKLWVSKPIFGREGAGVFRSGNFTSYDEFVYQTNINYGYDPQA